MKKVILVYLCFTIPLFAIEGYFEFSEHQKPLYWKFIWIAGLAFNFYMLNYIRRLKSKTVN